MKKNKNHAETATSKSRLRLTLPSVLLLFAVGSNQLTLAQQIRPIPNGPPITPPVKPMDDQGEFKGTLSLRDIANGSSNQSRANANARGSAVDGTASLKRRDEERGVQLGPESLQNTIPYWSDTFSYHGLEYKYKMVGTDPQKSSETTVIPTVIVPLRFVFPDGQVFDAGTQIVDGEPAVQHIINSPIFQNYDFVSGGTNVGNTQFGDAFQRANFWNSISTRARDYHVLLGQPTVLPTYTIVVPEGMGSYYTIPNSGIAVPLVDEVFLRTQSDAVYPALNISPRTLPILLWGTVLVSRRNKPGQLGYAAWHGVTNESVGAQTFIGTSYGWFPDVYALSHEVVEWLDNPFQDNFTPGWNHPFLTPNAQCDSGFITDQLEVADPVEIFLQAMIEVPGGPFTYHVTEAMFIDFFTRSDRSRSVNGQYSMFTIGAPFGLPSEPSTPCTGHVEVDKTLFSIPGARFTAISGINNFGSAVGYYFDATGGHGFSLQGSRLSSLNFPGSDTTIPSNLNDKGDIVGYFYDRVGFPHGFSYSNGQWTRIDFPGSVDTAAFGINASGEIVGAFDVTQPITHGFILRNGEFIRIDTPYGIQSELNGINDLGVITGVGGDDILDGPAPGFTMTKGSFTRFDFPGALLTLPESINNRNDLAGIFLDPDGSPWGMVTVNGYPQRVYADVLGINDLGQVCGFTYEPESGLFKAFIGELPLNKESPGP